MSGKAASSAPPAAKADGGKKEAATSPLVSTYLILYNLFSALGWAYLWLLIGQHFAAHGWEKGVPTLYAAIEQPLKLVQTAALLEIVHAILRFVKSSPVITAIQVASRLAVLWGIVHYSPPSQTSVFFTLMSVSWSLVEVPRYSWYLTELLGLQSGPLTYLRYSLFLVLYPTGITGECGSLWQSLSYFEGNQMRLGLEVALPNKWNLVYSHRAVLLFLLFAIYPFGSYVMYNNMWVARKKKLFPSTEDKKAQ